MTALQVVSLTAPVCLIFATIVFGQMLARRDIAAYHAFRGHGGRDRVASAGTPSKSKP
jgi:hypothetical protein